MPNETKVILSSDSDVASNLLDLLSFSFLLEQNLMRSSFNSGLTVPLGVGRPNALA